MSTTFATEKEQGQVESIDVSKCRFNVGPVKFMHDMRDDEVLHPVSILARTDKPLEHWYWGRIVHDISGIKLHKDSIVIDYCHDDHEIMGYLNNFDRENGLLCKGALVKRPGSKAEEVCFNAKHKVPYEASIFWDPAHGMVIEEVGQGASVQVNGFTFEGPGVVVRSCLLRAVAICPHGQDMNASTQFSNQNQTVSLSYKEAKMTKDGTSATPETKPDEAPVSQTEFNAMKAQFEELQTKFANSQGETEAPKDLPTALAQIEDLKTKLSKQTAAAADTDTDGDGAGKTPETKLSIEEQFEQMEKRLVAKFAHSANSDSESVSGNGNDDAEGKVKFSGMFRMRHQPQMKTEA